MPPTLRSTTNSPHNSPSAASRSEDATSTTPTTTPRKVHRCSKCNRPKAGHPRSGCPYTESPMKEKEQRTAKTLEKQLSVALESMSIASPAKLQGREEDDKAFIRNRRRLSAQPPPLVPSESLLSLSASSNEIVTRLLEPGVLDNSPKKDTASRIIGWQESLAMPYVKRSTTTTPGRSPMPGTLIPPFSDSSFSSSSHEVVAKEEIITATVNSSTDTIPLEAEVDLASSSSSSSSATEKPRSLFRSMSAEQRDLFVANLADNSSATIYIIPKVDVEDVVSKASKLKFFTAISMNDDEEDPHALIILGEDENAVKALFRKVEKENKKALLTNKERKSTTSTLKTAAGAAVIGAVSTWAGLAFS